MDKPQFDELLGGKISVPRDVQLSKLAEARGSEIAAITNCIAAPHLTKLIFQKLPVSMRRRVMSHNPNRLPRDKRDGHLNQMTKSGLPPKSKRPSRKYRRRPKNLLNEYNRRQRDKKWLETHIWHAKRFHMCEKWGYKIANYSNNRGYRSSYRAAANHCMLQDISYYICIELRGPFDILIGKLKNHCKDHLTFGAKIYTSGCREGCLMFYKKDNSPVGYVTFMWKPSEDSKERILWIWSHPAFSKYVTDELTSTFKFKKPDDDTGKYFDNKYQCSMELLRDSLNRFRLRGPLTISVLSDTLRLPDLSKIIGDPEETGEEISMENHQVSWDKNWYKDTKHCTDFNLQEETFSTVKTLNSPGQLPRHSILALTVLDPRFFLPQKRTKQKLDSNQYEIVYKFPQGSSTSPLWNCNVRKDVKDNFKTTNDINKLRSGNLVPGVENDSKFPQEVMTKIPVILVQHPGAVSNEKSLGFTSGVDVILPGNWALQFLLALMYRCVRPVGLREYKSVLFENLMLNSPEINHPDTQAYQQEAEETKRVLKEKYFRYPPNRRVNFTKCSITSPFFCEWKLLIKEWTNENEVHVLRDQKIISMLDRKLEEISNQRERMRKTNLKIQEEYDQSVVDEKKSHLVLVKITIEGRGKPKNFSLICKPSADDLDKMRVNKKWSGPVQKLKVDEFEKKRKIIKQKHRIFLKRAMRQRSRAKKLKKPIVNRYNSEEEKMKFKKIMEELYLPECKVVKKSCDRDVMGYIVQGDFSFTESRGVGWGYVVAKTLGELIESKSNIVLMRNSQSRQYRRAKIDIVNMYV